MRITYLYTFLFILLQFISCNKLDNNSGNRYNNLTNDIDISVTISNGSKTKSTISNSGKMTFHSGDNIRLFTLSQNLDLSSYRLKYQGDKWLPQLSWSAFKGEYLDFIAVYPDNNQNIKDNILIHTILSNQNEPQSYEDSDLLYSHTRAQMRSKVNLDFSHCMTRISVILRSDGSFTGEQIQNAKLYIHSYKYVYINTLSGKIIKGAEPSTIVFNHVGDSKFQSIVCPHSIIDEWRNAAWIKIEIAGKSFTYTAPKYLSDSKPFDELKSGHEIELTINLTNKENKEDIDNIEVWRNKTVWVYGIKNPPLSEWGYVSLDPKKELALTWKPEYGWFDCNKIDPNRQSRYNSDSEICWAAANSNMIHWWLSQNKDYVERYAKYKGPANNYPNSFDSEIFTFFKKNFPNTGNDVSASLNWFFTGRYGTTVRQGAAFFKDVFGEGKVISRIITPRRDNFTKEIKKALSSREAIECTIRIPRYLHAISVWGADFDDTGNVSALYIADNNDGDRAKQEKQYKSYFNAWIIPAGLVRVPVKIINDKVYMESSVAGRFTIEITDLNFLPLMHEKWEEYFASNN